MAFRQSAAFCCLCNFLFLFVYSQCARTADNLLPPLRNKFQGHWSWISKKGGSDAFEIYLIQNGNRVKGYHFASANEGRRLDNQEEPDVAGPSIEGTVNGNLARIKIHGALATMKLTPEGLQWYMPRPYLSDFPTGGYPVIPSNVMLKKDNKRVENIPDKPVR